MPITVQCPNLTCRAVLQVPAIARGKMVRCGRCQTAFRIPIKHEPPPPETEPTEQKPPTKK